MAKLSRTVGVACLVLVASALSVLAASTELTGSHLAGTDADGDGFADAAETAAGVAPGETPVDRAAGALASVRTDAGAAAAAGRALSDETLAESLDVGQAAVAVGAETSVGVVRTAAADVRGAIATVEVLVDPHLPASARTIADALVAVVAFSLGEAGASLTEPIEAANASVAGERAAVDTLAEEAFAFASAVAGPATSDSPIVGATVRAANDATRTIARFVYTTEPTTGLIHGEDASGLPATGIWVDVDHDGARHANGREDIAATDRDSDAAPDRVETLTGHDPDDDASTLDDIDYDRKSAAEEAQGGIAPYSVQANSGGKLVALSTSRSSTSVRSTGSGIETTDEGQPVVGHHRLEVCTGSALACALDPDRDGQTTLNELLLNGDPTDPDDRGAGGPIPPPVSWPQAAAQRAATTGILLSDDLRAALQVG